MAAVKLLGILALLAASGAAWADPPWCACDPDDPKTLEARECSLTREALKQPPELVVFFLKDANPRKPNRMLAIPRLVRRGAYTLASLPAEVRVELWRAAIEKARELWGDQWGLAVNGDEVRTQCQPHIHIGKFIEEVETLNFIEVDGPEQIPVPQGGQGLWVHQKGNKLHVHLGELLTESVLMR